MSNFLYLYIIYSIFNIIIDKNYNLLYILKL